MPEFRMPVMTLVEASWEDQGGASRTAAARMEDRSTGGACIRIKTPIGVGSKVRIQWRFEQFSGTAKYCRSEGREYLVGIQRDTTENPIPSQPVPADVPAPKSVGANVAAVSTVKAENLPKQQESRPNEIPVAAPKAETVPPALTATPAGAMPATLPHSSGYEMDDSERRRISRLDEFNALRRTQFKTKQLPKRAQAGKERKPMQRKWLELPWSNKPDGLSVSGDQGADENVKAEDEKENLRPAVTSPGTPPPKKSAAAREVPNFQVELLAMEDIYRAAGIMLPRKGYSIKKVVEMLNSAHICGLPKEMKRVALLMALDAAGVPIDEVLRDAEARRDAMDSYEAAERKQVEAEWARKAEENLQIQAELESIRAHYTARIGRNLEGVAREKATFDSWVTLKQEECRSIAEAAELCMKLPAPEPATASPSNGSMAKAATAATSSAKLL
ncbi:MAG: hypothetical protein WA254_12055 [Candidatus Sulfotelmatobacter sp.]